MGTRRNAKFLSATEKENFVKACVHMKADIVNPTAAANDQYSKWDEFTAIHWMIQNADSPGTNNVNFGHGGLGSYSFLSWHRYFLFLFEEQLRSYFPADDVRLPYWDWQDPAAIMTDDFIGPDGDPGSNNVIQQGYFAVDSPGTGSNATPAPGWWPAGLDGWRIPDMFPSSTTGGLRRNTGNPANLPTTLDIQETLAMTDLRDFQDALESGGGLTNSATMRMHNSMHGWIGGSGGHMNNPDVSPSDPFFYLLHCNVDRLWAMWQMDGHENEYPVAGGNPEHHRNDLMYPYTGGAAGYGTNVGISSDIPMPDFSGLGPQTNGDTLDFRNAFGYTYDTIAIMGIGLDRTGSMMGLTPDPMVSTNPDVTKWEAAKRGVSAFLQDAETVQESGAIYVMAGIKTFRSLGGNQFDAVFNAPNFGLVKTGTDFSQADFDLNVAAMSPGGGTPLADALADVQNNVVEPPFGGNPADEQRYLALLTDGMLTSGSPMASIPDGSYGRTAIFAMGFGTGADVDYPTLASVVAKGKTLTSQQVFQGENAGTIDKFYSEALAAAIGFTTIFDPVLELFAGEHAHMYFHATSAEDIFYITAQGMDFQDRNWTFMLHGPNGQLFYGDMDGHRHDDGCHHCCPAPLVTAKKSNGRLTLVVQRGNTGKDCWVGKWALMVLYKTKSLDSMMMPVLGEMLFPVAAGAIKGPRYARLTVPPGKRTPPRNLPHKNLHGLDFRTVSTNNSSRDACHIVVNIYARTSLKVQLQTEKILINPGNEIKIGVRTDSSMGAIHGLKGLARMVSPSFDIHDILPRDKVIDILKQNEAEDNYGKVEDIALLLARLEKKKELNFIDDSEVAVVSHKEGPLHLHSKATKVPGTYHFGIYVEGAYAPNAKSGKKGHNGHGESTEDTEMETFSRILNLSVSVSE
ncbi:tyrosinase family protein [Pricia sp. S334]|uniref:Tyrosinase family protein n=1 Tax=Pricia mediterranea TaxID=3076079 RepID=A0ABU3L7B5_9FLAO|nr:tyrosinase family protein [Pricia sp. S334]MDT7829352.1 tyrosinase family protein [Pricia sp. S334]